MRGVCPEERNENQKRQGYEKEFPPHCYTWALIGSFRKNRMSLDGKLKWFVLGQVEHIVQAVRANQPKSGLKRDGITWQSCLISAIITDKVIRRGHVGLGSSETNC